MNPKEEYINKWIIKADEDIAVIKQLSANSPEMYTSSICFHVQQAIEKYLKAFLVLHDVDFPKTHDIDFLLMECKKLEPNIFEHFDWGSLADYGVSLRYPDDFYIPSVDESLHYANQAYEMSDLIKKCIEKNKR